MVVPIRRWRVLNHANRVPDLNGLRWLGPSAKTAAEDSFAAVLAPPLPPKIRPVALAAELGDEEVARELDEELNREPRRRNRGVAHDLGLLEREVRGDGAAEVARPPANELGRPGGGQARPEPVEVHEVDSGRSRKALEPAEGAVARKKGRFETNIVEKKGTTTINIYAFKDYRVDKPISSNFI